MLFRSSSVNSQSHLSQDFLKDLRIWLGCIPSLVRPEPARSIAGRAPRALIRLKTMKTSINRILAVCLAAAFLLAAQSFAGPAGTAFSYSGRLNDKTTGQPANGDYEFRFQLFDTETFGSVVAGPVVVGVIGVTNGLFSTEIDFGAGAFPGDFARYLEVGVRRAGSGAAYEVFSRRQKINRVPFSQEANHAAAANSLVIQGEIGRAHV